MEPARREIDPKACQQLWQAAIIQALKDASAYLFTPEKLSRSGLRDGAHALEWLTGGSQDFRTVADLAGYNPDALLKALTTGDLWSRGQPEEPPATPPNQRPHQSSASRREVARGA